MQELTVRHCSQTVRETYLHEDGILDGAEQSSHAISLDWERSAVDWIWVAITDNYQAFEKKGSVTALYIDIKDAFN